MPHPATSDTTIEELEGIIEFKCLPSGLHNVKEDLMYDLFEASDPVMLIECLMTTATSCMTSNKALLRFAVDRLQRQSVMLASSLWGS